MSEEKSQKKIKRPVVMKINTLDLTSKEKSKNDNYTNGEKYFIRLYDALWNYIFLDYRRKDNLIRVETIDCNSKEPKFAYMTAAELLLHLIFWKPYVLYSALLKRKVVIDSHLFYNLDNFNKKTVSEMMKNIIKDFLDDAQIRENGINELSYYASLSIDDYCELVNSYCVIASNTISIYDIHQLEKRSPEFANCINTQLDESLPVKNIEQQLKKGEMRIIHSILSDGKSSLVNFIKSGRISHDQLTQMFYAVGPRTDVDKTILPKLIKGNFLKGYQCPSDAYMDAISGRDAQILKHITVRDSGYLSRKINLSCLNTHIDYNVKDCGTQYTIKYKVESEDHLKAIDLKYIVKHGKLYLVHSSKDRDLIGTTVDLRSHIVCALPKGHVCMTCFGAKAMRLKGTNIGGLPSVKIANPMSQRLMKAKHFSSTNSVDVKSEYMNKYFNIESNRLYFKPELKNKDIFVCIDRDAIEDIISGATNTDDELVETDTLLETITIIDNEERYTIECEGMYLSLTSDIMADSNKFITEYNSEEALIPVSKIDNDMPYFNMIIASEAVQQYLKKIKRVIDSSRSKLYTNPSDFIKDVSDILLDMGLSGTSIINIETLIYQQIRMPNKLYERPDFSKPNVEIATIPLSSAISNSDIYTAFGFEKLKMQLTNIDSFMKNGSGIFDPLFKIEKANYLIPVKKSTINNAINK